MVRLPVPYLNRFKYSTHQDEYSISLRGYLTSSDRTLIYLIKEKKKGEIL